MVLCTLLLTETHVDTVLRTFFYSPRDFFHLRSKNNLHVFKAVCVLFLLLQVLQSNSKAICAQPCQFGLLYLINIFQYSYLPHQKKGRVRILQVSQFLITFKQHRHSHSMVLTNTQIFTNLDFTKAPTRNVLNPDF